MRDIFLLLRERADQMLDALRNEIDSQDAELLMREPSDAIPWDDAKRLLDLP